MERKNKPAISNMKLRKLERMLYDRAMDGDTRLGLYLLKLYYKDLHRLDDVPLSPGIVFLPQAPHDDTCTGGISLPFFDLE